MTFRHVSSFISETFMMLNTHAYTTARHLRNDTKGQQLTYKKAL